MREPDIITISDSDASPADTGVHWDFGTSSSARRIQFTGHFKGIKEEDGAQEVAIGFPSSDDAEESTVARYNATVAELAHLCHCLKTQSSPPPRFHFSQLAQLPSDSIFLIAVIQRQKQNANRLPIQSVKVYFPCVLITKVLENLPRLALEDAVTVEQSVVMPFNKKQSPWGLPAMTPHKSFPRWFCERDAPSC